MKGNVVNTNDSFVTEVLSNVQGCEGLSVIQPVQIGHKNVQNELLMFIKPEIFAVDDQQASAKSLNLIVDKLQEFEVLVNGVVIVGGPLLEQKESMDRHYGAINVLSRTASQALTDADKASIYEALSVAAADYPIFGGHEFLADHPTYTPYALDDLWFTKKSVKIRSGFYIQSYAVDGEKFILVNGFHPAQLAHFTESNHRIVLLLLQSDTNWAVLRDQMIGETFPEKADKGSIRGSLYADPATHGFDTVSIANNCVHLSAGPFEAMFEIKNFFGSLMDIDITVQQPGVLQKMLNQQLSLAQALASLQNPDVNVDGDSTDLFDASEHMDTDPAVSLYKANL